MNGWDKSFVTTPEHLHPVTDKCGLIMSESQIEKEEYFVTLTLWKKGNKSFRKKELAPIKSVSIDKTTDKVTIVMSDKSIKVVELN